MGATIVGTRDIRIITIESVALDTESLVSVLRPLKQGHKQQV
jgi:hypothetical protein